MRTIVLLMGIVVLGTWCDGCPATEPQLPTGSVLRQQAAQCRDILKTNIINFYLPACIDQEHGGYLEWEQDKKFVGTGEKFLTMQARQLWFFSTMAARGIEREPSLQAAQSGFKFLEQKFLDPVHGGYFAKVSDSGSPIDRRKHVYLNSFALYALSAYYAATRDEVALASAQKLFRKLEEKCHDSKSGGYLEFFEESWMPILDRGVHSFIGPGGTKTYNTHLHVLEAFAELYRVWPDPLVRRRLEEVLLINTHTVRLPEYGCNVDGFLPHWRRVDAPSNARASYGHDVEGSWLCLDAARTLGHSPGLLRSWAEGLVGYSLKHGFDETHGGFFNSGPLGKNADDTQKVWWVQAEALVAMLELYRLTGEPRYYAAFDRTFQFVQQHQLAHGGSWWATCRADGTPLNSTRTSMWQGAYHNGRAMLLCADLLDGLANDSK